MIKRDLLFRDSDDPCIAAEVDYMDGRIDEERESWDVMVEDGDSDDNGLASNIDDSEDAEVHILTLDEI